MKPTNRFFKMRAGIPAALVMAGAAFTQSVEAVPVLQLYVEGATYDGSSQTWVASAGSTLRLWTIGNVSGPGGAGDISNVKLAIAYAGGGSTPNFTLSPSTTGDFGGYTDPTVPSAPSFLQNVTDGSSPLLTGGGSLASHGIYGVGTHWTEFSLGSFTGTESPTGDFISSFPNIPADTDGSQINVYEISADQDISLHFDLYGSTVKPNGSDKAQFAPFSHDAEGTPRVPDGGATAALLGLGLMGLATFARKR